VALVTGGASGIGLATVRCLAEHGAALVIGDVDLDRAVESVSELADSGLDLRAEQLDVADALGWRRVVDQVVGESGGIDVLVNNAGINTNDTIMTTDPEARDRTERAGRRAGHPGRTPLVVARQRRAASRSYEQRAQITNTSSAIISNDQIG
jgi:NAD(P)-dependent dehydrogenase (short-subunit alcohol dehydrogenase family)